MPEQSTGASSRPVTNKSEVARISALDQQADQTAKGEQKSSRHPVGDSGFLILDRYIFREFAMAFFAVMAFCALLLLVANIFEKFGDLMEQSAPISKAALYFICQLPFDLLQVVPIASMLAVLFSVGTLARHNEVLAMLTSGIHSLRLAAPVIVGGVMIFIITLGLSEYIVPPLEQKARIYEQLYIEGKSADKLSRERNVFARGKGNRFYLMRAYSGQEKKMLAPQIVDVTDDYRTVTRRIVGESAVFISNDKEAHQSRWMFVRPRIWEFDPAGQVKKFVEYKGEVPVLLEENLTEILLQQKEPEEMNFAELNQHVRILEERNQPTFALRTDLLNKITFPFGILLIMIIGFSYAVRSRAGTAVAAFGYGIMWAFIYYMLSATMQALGHAGTLPPSATVIITLLTFVLVAAYYLHRSARWHA